jgi:hypothetical protein
LPEDSAEELDTKEDLENIISSFNDIILSIMKKQACL